MAVKPPVIVKKIIPQRQVTPLTYNFSYGRGGNIITSIVDHTYNGVGTSLFNWFAYQSPATSAHFAVLKDGTIEQYVELEDTAHHCGDDSVNAQSIGIEHQDDGNPFDYIRTPKQYEASARLHAWLSEKFNFPLQFGRYGILRHFDVTDTGCPGGLDIEGILIRARSVIEAENGWKSKVQTIARQYYSPEKDFFLYDITTDKPLYDTKYPEGTIVDAQYKLGDYMITDFSFNSNYRKGFRIVDLEYKKPIVEPPVEPEKPTEPIEPEIPELPDKPKFNLITWLINLIFKKQ